MNPLHKAAKLLLALSLLGLLAFAAPAARAQDTTSNTTTTTTTVHHHHHHHRHHHHHTTDGATPATGRNDSGTGTRS